MLSWWSAPQGPASGSVDDTVLDAPETPAPVFAVRAFKHAIWGTPQPLPTTARTYLRPQPEKQPAKSLDIPTLSLPDLNESQPPPSPTKGILLTPGTARSRKQVSFGMQVVDNEGKRPKVGRALSAGNGPARLQGTFTSKAVETAPKQDGPFPALKPRAKDDADITLDLSEPRSESGRYWKEQYMTYSAKSEDEVRKLIQKQKIAKDYAKKKDEEARILQRQLEEERARRREREQALEAQVKELRERLRKAMTVNAKSSAEITSLKMQVDAGENIKRSESVPAIRNIDLSVMDSAIAPTPAPSDLQADSILQATHSPQQVTDFSMARYPSRHDRGRRPIRVRRGSDSMMSINSNLDSRPRPRYARTTQAESPLKPRDPNIETASPQRSTTPRNRDKPPVFRSASVRSMSLASTSRQSLIEAAKEQPPPKELTASNSGLWDIPDPSEMMFDSNAPLQALGMQADQPVTPSRGARRKAARVPAAGPVVSAPAPALAPVRASPPIPVRKASVPKDLEVEVPDRLAAAQARILARKAQRKAAA
ncbi:hypothetical protein EJ06DRAFT_518958 [Trichodelitschia bisporula]|uniref:Spindle pole body-associated protein cut12 domain-containing protein n=1 Tax=Trichodelitschia bisporula TaxID=703511 RepID=A0A6G1I8G3_9PEZI|nr:hypothetical protein EJ06DRAFT_518958 [Trichodelitschia bisporula]